jgi:ABC-type branched-subunit amino acid transport system ATPase component
MATEPKLMLLDEPAAGMNPAEKDKLIKQIGRLRDEQGYSIILIEHDMPVIKSVSDRVVALDHGIKIAEGTYQEVSSNQQVIEAYLGKAAAEQQELPS